MGDIRIIYFNNIAIFQWLANEDTTSTNVSRTYYFKTVYDNTTNQILSTMNIDEGVEADVIFTLQENGKMKIYATIESEEYIYYEGTPVLTDEEYNYANKNATYGFYEGVPYINEETNECIIMRKYSEDTKYSLCTTTLSAIESTDPWGNRVVIGTDVTITDENTIEYNSKTYVRDTSFNWNNL